MALIWKLFGGGKGTVEGEQEEVRGLDMNKMYDVTCVSILK